MRIVRGKDYTAARAWDAQDIAAIPDATVRLHWTDQAYPWHVNDGAEVFAVLDGSVDMHYRADGVESVVLLQAGDLFCVDEGDAHSARPRGQARVLVVEKRGSA